MSRYQCWNCLTHYNGDYERCDNCISKGHDKPTNWRPGPNYVPPTNADRLRAMSDEEMAEYLCGLTYCCECEHRGTCNGGDGYLKWLQQPAEEVCGMKGLYSKYEVRKRSDGTPVNNCFVLRPDRDDAAIAAMLAYADATSDSQLAKELREWVEFEQRVRCKEDSQ